MVGESPGVVEAWGHGGGVEQVGNEDDTDPLGMVAMGFELVEVHLFVPAHEPCGVGSLHLRGSH